MAVTNKTESRNFSATSAINETTVMYMNASYNTSSNDLSFNQSIQNMELYRANKTVVDNDFDTWKDEVYTEIFG